MAVGASGSSFLFFWFFCCGGGGTAGATCVVEYGSPSEEGTGALDMGLVGDAEVVVGGGRGRVAGSGGGKGFGSDGRILIGRRWEKC